MNENSGDWLPTIYATAISLASVALGTVIRYFHQARRNRTKIDFRRLAYEVPTIIGLTIVAVPVSEYVRTTFAVEQGVMATTCLCLGYIGTRILDVFAKFLEEKPDAAEKD